MKRVLILLSLLLFAIPSVFAQVAPAPSLLNFQGRLAKPDGTPLPDATYTVTFSLWDVVSGGSVMTNQLWSETDTVTLHNGSFATLLGNRTAFPGTIFNGSIYLQIQIGSDAPLTPRQQIVSVAFALKANTVPDNSITNTKIVSVDWSKITNAPTSNFTLPFAATVTTSGNAFAITSSGTAIYGATTGTTGYGGYFTAPTGGISLKAVGKVQVGVLQVTGGSDVAEPYHVAAAGNCKPAPGLLVSIDPDSIGQMRVASKAYDRTVGGILSGANGVQPGLTLQQEGTVADGTYPVASVGRVWCWCDADANGAIAPGDLLTTSDTPGHAMKVTDFVRANGAVIGKAMSTLKSGRGMVLVLVTLK